jgi:toxin FitB
MRTYQSVVTLGELRTGADRLADGRRRDRLDRWLTGELPEGCGGRLLAVDAVVADECGRLLASAENAGSAVGGSDALIAATAKVHGLQVVTRKRQALGRHGRRCYLPPGRASSPGVTCFTRVFLFN